MVKSPPGFNHDANHTIRSWRMSGCSAPGGERDRFEGDD
jgi:hypothetical protein